MDIRKHQHANLSEASDKFGMHFGKLWTVQTVERVIYGNGFSRATSETIEEHPCSVVPWTGSALVRERNQYQIGFFRFHG